MKYLQVLLCVVGLLWMVFGYVYQDKDDCLTYIDYCKTLETHLVVKHKKQQGRSVILTGIDPKTNFPVRFVGSGEYDVCRAGDTLIKEKDVFYAKIKRGNVVYLLNQSCSGLSLDSIICYKK